MPTTSQVAEIITLATVLNTSRHVCAPDTETEKLRSRYSQLVTELLAADLRLVLPPEAMLHRNHW